MKDLPDLSPDPVILQRENFQQLLDVIIAKKYKIAGPKIKDGAVILDEILKTEDLPIGWSDSQESATYRLIERGDRALFRYALGPQSWKKFLYPSVQKLYEAHRTQNGWKISSTKEPKLKFAFLGVRPCEIEAINALDRVFREGEYSDPGYKKRRQNTLIIAVNCGVAGGTCFCASMDTGPKAKSGFDLALTEVLENEEHYFVVEVGTKLGAEIVKEIEHTRAGQEQLDKAQSISAAASDQMGRELDTSDLYVLLSRSSEHPQWKDIASRCLTCGNCTMVCPTCFCSTVEDYTDLQGKEAVRVRRWDSCFTMDYSYIHGGSVRYSAEARYRQWLTHKFANWLEQFGTFGCVGCGRCITWCPAAIDITEEIKAIGKNQTFEKKTA